LFFEIINCKAATWQSTKLHSFAIIHFHPLSRRRFERKQMGDKKVKEEKSFEKGRARVSRRECNAKDTHGNGVGKPN
jgi:hypothetical protein